MTIFGFDKMTAYYYHIYAEQDETQNNVVMLCSETIFVQHFLHQIFSKQHFCQGKIFLYKNVCVNIVCLTAFSGMFNRNGLFLLT